jgi:hypothetical protein
MYCECIVNVYHEQMRKSMTGRLGLFTRVTSHQVGFLELQKGSAKHFPVYCISRHLNGATELGGCTIYEDKQNLRTNHLPFSIHARDTSNANSFSSQHTQARTRA